MTTATLTSKGQITMPQAVRQTLGLQTGDKVDFVPDDAGGFKVIALRKDVKALRGRFAGRARQSISVEDMTAAVQAEAVEHMRPAVRARGAKVKRSK